MPLGDHVYLISIKSLRKTSKYTVVLYSYVDKLLRTFLEVKVGQLILEMT
jgi:hypothetical protein